MTAAAIVYGAGNVVCFGSAVLVPVSVSLMIKEYFSPPRPERYPSSGYSSTSLEVL